MKLSGILRTFSICSGLIAGSANAAITYQLITNDANSGISNANTYTHAADLGGGTIATVNGVSFTNAPGNYTTDHNGSNNGSPNNLPGGGLGNLMQGFQFRTSPNPVGAVSTITLGGLSAGTTYDFRIYSGRWDTGADRTNIITFDPDGAGAISESTTINQNNASTVPGESFASDAIYYINYRYTAVANENLSVKFEIANSSLASWHLYGLTNQVVPAVIPEPGALVLSVLGGMLFLRRRRNA